jgi:hypothetical protein
LAALDASNKGAADAATAALDGFIAAAGTDDTGEALASAAREALNDANARPRGRIQPTASLEPGGIRLEFNGTRGAIYIVEASADMVNWAWIGVAREDADGTFAFEETEVQPQACRFYRIVTP